MNCPKCGTPIPQGAAFCPVCNEPLSAYVQPGYMPGYAQGMPQGYPPPGPGVGVQPPMSGAQGMQPPPAAQQPYMGAQQQPYPQQQNLYRQSYAQYQQGTYPPGFQQPYSYGQPAAREANPLLTALSALPRTFLDSFTRPQEVLRGMLEKRDLLTGPIVAGLTLLLTFLCGMVVMRSFVGVLLSAISALTGVSLASDAASMNQGISYIAGRIAPSVGGAAVLCQLIGMAVPALVFLVYLCGVAKVHFSWELLLGFVAVTTLPHGGGGAAGDGAVIAVPLAGAAGGAVRHGGELYAGVRPVKRRHGTVGRTAAVGQNAAGGPGPGADADCGRPCGRPFDARRYAARDGAAQ